MKTSRSHFLSYTLASALAFGQNYPALASEPNYAVVGAACVPTGQTSAAAVHFNTAGETTFNGTKTGEIILTCPIPQTLASASRLEIIYRDTDGIGATAQVSAALRQKDLNTATVSTVGIAKVDSNSQAPVATYSSAKANIAAGGCGVFTFDHTSKAYYVQVNLKRTTTAQQAIIASVQVYTPEC